MDRQMQNLDSGSILGSVVSLGFTMIGIIALQEAAIWIGIIAGATTIILNLVKIVKELLK